MNKNNIGKPLQKHFFPFVYAYFLKKKNKFTQYFKKCVLIFHEKNHIHHMFTYANFLLKYFETMQASKSKLIWITSMGTDF